MTMKPSASPYRVDPADPIAPTAEVWARLSEDERALVVVPLPTVVERT